LDGLDADVALLQEARSPRSGYALEEVPDDLASWSTAGWGQSPTGERIDRALEAIERGYSGVT
jgi:hypothetical protein